MAKKLGLSANRCFFVGRIVGNPEITGDWAKMFMKTIVPENQNGNWVELDCIVPMMTNNPRTIDTIQKFIQDERQLIVEGYVTSWQNQQGSVECAVMITNIMATSPTDPGHSDQLDMAMI